MKVHIRMLIARFTRAVNTKMAEGTNDTIRGRGESWNQEETILLIELWGDQRVQEELDTKPRRNIDIFKRICQDIKGRIPEFERSPEDCRARIKRLKTKYSNLKIYFRFLKIVQHLFVV